MTNQTYCYDDAHRMASEQGRRFKAPSFGASWVLEPFENNSHLKLTRPGHLTVEYAPPASGWVEVKPKLTGLTFGEALEQMVRHGRWCRCSATYTNQVDRAYRCDDGHVIWMFKVTSPHKRSFGGFSQKEMDATDWETVDD
ncbi:MAG: hypothetical protein NXI16_01410 [Alphaproteobacteria bacterium]|nr:hypothetical protein [Alphaproteobacteria bacterium]